MGTLIFAAGVFLAFRDFSDGPLAEAIARLGRLALGMYCVHAAFTTAFNAVFLPETRAITPIWTSFAAAVVVVVASTGVTMVLARIPPLRRFVA